MKKIKTILKRILISFFMLYSYNILVPSAAFIPINLITLSVLTIFDVPGLIFLIIIRLIIY